MIHVRNASGAAAGLALILSLAFAGAGAAQDATPAATTAGHPAHIHEGTCDALNPAPLYPLADVAAPDGAADAATGGAAMPTTVETSTTTVEVALADIAGGGFAINVHESADNIETYIACGDIGGAIMPGADADAGSQLAIGLRELNGSGYAGVAVLREAGAQTEVAIYLAEGLTGGTGAADDEGDATPTS